MEGGVYGMKEGEDGVCGKGKVGGGEWDGGGKVGGVGFGNGGKLVGWKLLVLLLLGRVL